MRFVIVIYNLQGMVTSKKPIGIYQLQGSLKWADLLDLNLAMVSVAIITILSARQTHVAFSGASYGALYCILILEGHSDYYICITVYM